MPTSGNVFPTKKKKAAQRNLPVTLQEKFARLAEMLNEVIMLFCKGHGKGLAGLQKDCQVDIAKECLSTKEKKNLSFGDVAKVDYKGAANSLQKRG